MPGLARAYGAPRSSRRLSAEIMSAINASCASVSSMRGLCCCCVSWSCCCRCRCFRCAPCQCWSLESAAAPAAAPDSPCLLKPVAISVPSKSSPPKSSTYGNYGGVLCELEELRLDAENVVAVFEFRGCFRGLEPVQLPRNLLSRCTHTFLPFPRRCVDGVVQMGWPGCLLEAEVVQ
jgi:hypothetical protein